MDREVNNWLEPQVMTGENKDEIKRLVSQGIDATDRLLWGSRQFVAKYEQKDGSVGYVSRGFRIVYMVLSAKDAHLCDVQSAFNDLYEAVDGIK